MLCLLVQVLYLFSLEPKDGLHIIPREQAISLRTRWVFVHYHKSGHDIAKNLRSIFTNANCSNLTVHIPKRIDISPFISLMATADITVLSAPDFLFDWKEMMSTKTDIIKAVHFVREPLEMILSGYLYHRQSPPPSSEGWLLKDLDVCSLNPNNYIYSRIISTFIKANESILTEQIAQIHQLCQELQHRYKGSSAHATLRNASGNGELQQFVGLRLEAARSLISIYYGDLLRMTANAIFESSAPLSLAHRVYTSELPVGELGIFTHTMSNVLDFLMNESIALTSVPYVHQPFWQGCLNKTAALQKTIDQIYISTSPVPAAPKIKKLKNTASSVQGGESVHITQGLITPGLREYFKHRLLQDPVLGPVLDTIRKVLYNTQRQASTR